ncbi:MAG TPA: hydroxyphenylacetyl-CoA thioesterase PaaI [Steroidobacteraceae bacterium]|nr:hydroxyphenylacetyl-CoA thioesterase PaaI [Steroidobacteraceae bacterium]
MMASETERQRTAERAVEALWRGDAASRWLGMIIESCAPGRATVTMRIRADMVNGHGICHGGLIFALADSAFAFACNSHGDNTVAAGASIDFLAPGREGDVLRAVAFERWRAGRSGLYEIEVRNQRDEMVALFRGRSHQVAGRLIDD